MTSRKRLERCVREEIKRHWKPEDLKGRGNYFKKKAMAMKLCSVKLMKMPKGFIYNEHGYWKYEAHSITEDKRTFSVSDINDYNMGTYASLEDTKKAIDIFKKIREELGKKNYRSDDVSDVVAKIRIAKPEERAEMMRKLGLETEIPDINKIPPTVNESEEN